MISWIPARQSCSRLNPSLEILLDQRGGGMLSPTSLNLTPISSCMLLIGLLWRSNIHSQKTPPNSCSGTNLFWCVYALPELPSPTILLSNSFIAIQVGVACIRVGWRWYVMFCLWRGCNSLNRNWHKSFWLPPFDDSFTCLIWYCHTLQSPLGSLDLEWLSLVITVNKTDLMQLSKSLRCYSCRNYFMNESLHCINYILRLLYYTLIPCRDLEC